MKPTKPSSSPCQQAQATTPYFDVDNILKSPAPVALEMATQLNHPELIRALLRACLKKNLPPISLGSQPSNHYSYHGYVNECFRGFSQYFIIL